MIFGKPITLPTPDQALAGRETPMPLTSTRHYLNQHSIVPPWPQGFQEALFGMGCFWGAERLFWESEGVWVTAVGYAGGYTPNPTYAEVCTGQTGHTEVARVVFDPEQTDYWRLLQIFWEGHDPTQAMRQGNDVGTQYRSAVFAYGDTQLQLAEQSRARYQARLDKAGCGAIETEIKPAPAFYYAEQAHQQYLAKNPGGYCGLGGTGISCPSPA